MLGVVVALAAVGAGGRFGAHAAGLLVDGGASTAPSGLYAAEDEGVGVVDPSSTWVDVTAELAQDVTLEQGVLVRGTTRIGQGARVGAYAILTDAVIPAGCVVAPFSQLDADAAQA